MGVLGRLAPYIGRQILPRDPSASECMTVDFDQLTCFAAPYPAVPYRRTSMPVALHSVPLAEVRFESLMTGRHHTDRIWVQALYETWKSDLQGRLDGQGRHFEEV
jgi:hypothetical protein